MGVSPVVEDPSMKPALLVSLAVGLAAATAGCQRMAESEVPLSSGDAADVSALTLVTLKVPNMT
jgi:hypothetical protein